MKPSLKALLDRVEALSPEVTAEEAVEYLSAPKDSATAEARRLAALVRVVDAKVYEFLTNDRAELPTLEELIRARVREFQRVPPAGWEMTGDTREVLLKGWSTDPAWRKWNTRLYQEYFAPQKIPAAEIEAVYHAAAGENSADGIRFFEECYRAADDRNELSHCRALLESLRVQVNFRGPDFGRVYRDYTRNLEARMMFIEALQKTSFYVDRIDAQKKMGDMIAREAPAPWIFHLHATGGLGKTTLQNRIISRDLVRRRIPCAYADFDDEEVKKVVAHPFRLLSLILRQWTAQMTDEVFVSAANWLNNLDDISQWKDVDLGPLRLSLQGAQASFPKVMIQPMVVMLDTLEDLTLSRTEWLEGCIQALSLLHEFLPKLTVILSGRYNMAERGQNLPLEKATIYELGHFVRDEGLVYLRLRKITDPRMQEAILNRAAVVTEKGTTYNPFKLSLMAELVLDRDDLSPEDVRRLPSVDIAYLVERVILRIGPQPLRWMIRYASVTRHFTQEFLNQVLLPPLKMALEGKAADLSTTHPNEQIQKYLDSKVPWKSDNELAKNLDGDSLWKELKEYARLRGWISLGESNEVMRLHPEVVDPVRELLRQEPVFRTLQHEARDYFVASWKKSKRAANAVEATFHAQELDGEAAASLWREMLGEAQESGDLQGAYEIAKEATQYVIPPERREPYYPEWYAEAHVFCAVLKVREAGPDFTPQDGRWDTFVDHLAEAKRTHPSSVPLYLAVLVSAVRDHKTESDRALALETGLDQVSVPGEQFWLHKQAAAYFESGGNMAKAEDHWLAARDSASSAKVEQWRLELQLADFYMKSGRYTKAMESLQAASAKMPLKDRQNAVIRGAEWALDHHDLRAAEKFFSRIPKEIADLKLQLRLDTYTGAILKDYRIPQDMPLAQRAPVESILGEWEAYCLNFSAAREHFGNAKNAYQEAPSLVTSRQRRSRWTNLEKNIEAGIREITFSAFEMGAYQEAERLIEKVSVISDPDQRAAVELARAFSAIGLGKRETAESAVRDALGLASAPRMRLRATILALVFDLHPEPPSATAMNVLLRSLDPPNLCVEAFEFLPYCSEPSKQLATLIRPIESWATRNFDTLDDLPGSNLEDLQRLASLPSGNAAAWNSRPGSKLKLLATQIEERPTPGQLVRLLLEVEKYERQHKPTLSYEQLLRLARGTKMEDTPLGALLKAKTALELVRAGKSTQARPLAAEAGELWLQQPDSRRRREVQRILRGLEETSTRATKEPEQEPGPEMIEPPLQQVALRYPESVGEQLDGGQSFELVSAMFQWQVFFETLKKELMRHPASPMVPLRAVTTLEQAIVPWEFVAGSFTFPMICRGVVKEAEMRTSSQLRHGVLVIKPDDEDNLAFSPSDVVSSGFGIERVYAESASEAHYVQTMHEPQPGELHEGLRRIRPGLIHLVGQMVEGRGVALDFEGAGKRLFRSASKSPRLESRLDPERLVRYLEGQCPFVILDITTPENITDALQMLLQRNRFAAELLRTGRVSGVLATGLWQAWDREERSRRLVQCVHENATQSSLWNTLRIGKEPKDLSDAVSNYSTALFSLRPFRKLFGDTQ